MRPLPRDEAGLIALKEERFTTKRLLRKSPDHQAIRGAIIDNKVSAFARLARSRITS
jgi:hypothetical protein